jgi:preprotein translocase subunit YajC
MHTGRTFTAEEQKDRAAKGLKLTIMIVPIMGLLYFQYHHQQETRQSRQYE